MSTENIQTKIQRKDDEPENQEDAKNHVAIMQPAKLESTLSIQQLDDGSSTTETQYLVTCIDNTKKQNKNFIFSSNPFTLHDVPKAPTPLVLRVFLEARGRDAPADWNHASHSWHCSASALSPAAKRIVVSKPLEGTVDSEEDTSASEEESFDAAMEGLSMSDEQNVKDNFKGDLGTFRPSTLNVMKIEIVSKHLMGLFRSFITAFPGYNFQGEELVIRPPFAILALYFRDLEQLRDSQSGETQSGNGKNIAERLGGKTLHDLTVLLDYFSPLYERISARQEATHKTGFTSFDQLWFLFRPGQRVYGKIGGKFGGYIFQNSTQKLSRRRRVWEGYCWCLKYKGHRITREGQIFVIHDFFGQREIKSMIVFPSNYLDINDGKTTKRLLQKRGEKYFQIVRAIPAHFKYKGDCWDMEKMGTSVTASTAYTTRRKISPDTVRFY